LKLIYQLNSTTIDKTLKWGIFALGKESVAGKSKVRPFLCRLKPPIPQGRTLKKFMDKIIIRGAREHPVKFVSLIMEQAT